MRVTATQSDEENMAGIETLASEVEALHGAFAVWTQWTIGLLAASVLVAAGYFFVSFATNIRARQLEEKQVDLAKAKEAQLATDLAGKDASIAEAQRDAAAAQKEAAGAILELTQVKVDLAKQQERAADAERKYLEIQERLSFRKLSAAQRAQLIESLRIVPKGPARVFHVAQNREASEFAAQIRDVMRAAGWNTGAPNSLLGLDVVGLGILVRDPKDMPQYTADIQHAFAAASIELPVEAHDGVDKGGVWIIVGHKR